MALPRAPSTRSSGGPTDTSDWVYAAKAAAYNETVEAGLGDHTVSVPISKDNVFFGVRSCDASGHCSAAVAPDPEIPTRK